MLRWSLLVLCLVACMSVIASAEVFIEYWPVGDTPNGVNDPIEADISAGDVNITLNIGVTAPGGETRMAAAESTSTRTRRTPTSTYPPGFP